MTEQRERAFHQVAKEHHGLRLDQCMSRVFPELSRRQARELISTGHVWINGRPIRVLSRRVWQGDRITCLTPHEAEVGQGQDQTRSDVQETGDGTDASAASDSSAAQSTTEDSPDESSRRHHHVIDWEAFGGRPAFLFRDNYLAVLNKAPGIPTEPTPREDLRTCLRQMEAVLREEGLHPRRLYVAAVHRLDAHASGALAFALRKKAAAELSAQFATRSASRIYHALVVGRIEQDEGELRHHLARVGPGIRQGVVSDNRGKLAITQYRVLERFADASLVELQLQTGRTHQIRVQMAAIDHPLLGDWLYLSKQDAARCPTADRLMLHAISLSLNHPATQERMTFEAPLPDDFVAYLEALRNAARL